MNSQQVRTKLNHSTGIDFKRLRVIEIVTITVIIRTFIDTPAKSFLHHIKVSKRGIDLKWIGNNMQSGKCCCTAVNAGKLIWMWLSWKESIDKQNWFTYHTSSQTIVLQSKQIKYTWGKFFQIMSMLFEMKQSSRVSHIIIRFSRLWGLTEYAVQNSQYWPTGSLWFWWRTLLLLPSMLAMLMVLPSVQ